MHAVSSASPHTLSVPFFDQATIYLTRVKLFKPSETTVKRLMLKMSNENHLLMTPLNISLAALFAL